MNTDTSFHLRCELRGHSEDVRALLVNDVDVITASRDKTLMAWAEDHSSSGMGGYKQNATLVGHKDFVTAVAWMPPSLNPRFPQGALVSGSRDKSIILWDVGAGSPLQVLEGHEYQVTAVCIGEGGSVVSASLDKTVRVWNAATGEAAVLQGHEGPVLCCIVLSNGDILSGAGDMTIRRWSGGKCVSTLKAHTDSVRGLAEVPGIGFVSASHDQTLKVWTMGGETLAELVGHQALVYSAAYVADKSLIVSASEDRTCRVWTLDGACIQTIEHPSCVWDVAALPNGDFVSGCGDHQAYVWSSSPDRTASEDLTMVFQGSLPAAKGAEEGGASGGGGALPPGLSLEPPEALMQPGRPGQTKVISEGGVGIAYTWNADAGEWEKIGQVVDGPGDDSNMAVGSKFYNGQMWDHVFDVDVADGAPPLKLAVNKGENPYEVAERFLVQHELPVTYRDQIVQFILQNTAGDVTLPGNGVNPDPFTGGGAYVPSASPAGFGAQAPGLGNGGVTGGGADPFTGGSSKPTALPLKHCPLGMHLLWTTKLGNPSAVLGRIKDLSSGLSADMQGYALTAEEVAEGGPLSSLLQVAASFSSAEVAAVDCPFTDAQLKVLAKMMVWPGESLYPALDIARLAALTSKGATMLAAGAGDVAHERGSNLGAAVARALQGGPASQQTCLKLLSNCCSLAPLKSWLLNQAPAILDASAGCISSPKPAVQLAHTTMLMNLSLLLRCGGASPTTAEIKAQALSSILELLLGGQGDDLLFRALVTAGTLLHGDTELQSMAHELGFVDVTASAPSRAKDAKVAEVAKEVQAIIEGKI